MERVSYERCCCGLAIPLMYDYLYARAVKQGGLDPTFHAKIKAPLDELLSLLEHKSADDSINKKISEINPLIFAAGLRKEDKVCIETVELFASLYGAETGNLALKILPSGGIYLMSTITVVLKEYIAKEPAFMVRNLHHAYRPLTSPRAE